VSPAFLAELTRQLDAARADLERAQRAGDRERVEIALGRLRDLDELQHRAAA
jgi:hypothetical protein